MKPFVNPPSIYPYDEWKIVEDRYEERHHLRNESVFALGNGYIGMRGNFEEGFQGTAGRSVSGTYLNGFYESEPIVYPEGAYGYAKNSQTMLNVTDSKRIGLEMDGESFSMFAGAIVSYERELDLKRGVLTRSVVWESPSGKRASIRFQRLVCLSRKHLAAIQVEVTPLNFSGSIAFVSLLDGEVVNQAGEDDPRLKSGFAGQVLQTEQRGHSGSFAWIRQKTKRTGFTLLSASEHELDAAAPYRISAAEEAQRIELRFEVSAMQGQRISLTKYMSYHTSRDYPEAELADRACRELAAAKESGFAALLSEQQRALDEFWQRTDVEIEGDPALQQGIRFNAFQLLQAAGRDGKTNIGAKGLTGEGYEGHYFWDTEIYMLPFFIYTNPDIGRALLEYRYGTLDKARQRAREMSQKGALYPWRTIGGEETSAYFPAGTAQVHINSDIIYGLKTYVKASGDDEFLVNKGAEMLFETARFWVDLGYFNPRRDGLFCIDAVTGPDEYTAIVNNNAFTNLMVKDHLEFACETFRWLRAEHPDAFARLAERIGLADSEAEEWRKAAELMFIPTDPELAIVAQDDTFLQKKKWDFEHTPEDKYPLLLHYHPLVIYRHQVLKQADVVLALFLQGNRFTLADKMRNYHYYEPLTTHDSSLSPCTHSIIAAEIGLIGQAYDYFNRTARMDLDDINRNVKDGLHTASMAGSWLSIVYGFAGMRDYDGMLRFDPVLPGQWRGYRFKISYRKRLLGIHVTRKQVTYRLLEGESLEIAHRYTVLTLRAGVPVQVSLEKRLEAVLFDLDGVITDTAEYHYQAWKKLADELGIPFDRKVNERLKGIGRMESLDILLEPSGRSFTAEQKKELAARKNGYYKAMIGQMTPNDMLPGVKHLLTELKAEGFKLGLASASENAPLVLSKLGIENEFDVVVDARALKKGKPDPEIFLTAAEKLRIHPGHCIGIEDAAAGIAAIRAARMVAVGVGDPQQLAQADLVVGQVSQITPSRLKALFQS